MQLGGKVVLFRKMDVVRLPLKVSMERRYNHKTRIHRNDNNSAEIKNSLLPKYNIWKIKMRNWRVKVTNLDSTVQEL